MKKIILFTILLLGLQGYSQFDSYKKATINLRNGEILEGEARVTNEFKVKFRNKKDKKTFDYKTLERLEIYEDDHSVVYIYKIISGVGTKLVRVVKEYPGIINLYAVVYHNVGGNPSHFSTPFGSGANPTIEASYDVVEFYANKGSGHDVIRLGNTSPIFGKGYFKKAVRDFFSDCPEIIEKVENNEFKRGDMQAIVEYYKDHCAP